jgi:hypothetical protein
MGKLDTVAKVVDIADTAIRAALAIAEHLREKKEEREKSDKEAAKKKELTK